jgi:UDP-N-acetylmuramyl pentapeptide phosphotransferase/UDP-N-acetylglucosamine-1-phosphate transferase
MIISSDAIFLFTSLIFAALIAFTTTPMTRMIAYKIGAIDVPRDNRRMHKEPIPRLGGLSIFLGFTLTSLVFCDFSPSLIAMWLGGVIIVVTGILDDVFRLNPLVKLGAQIVVAVIAVSQGLTITFINFFGTYINFGIFSIPITLLWIVGLTNAINLIDGLDGLSCGVSAICSASLLIVMILGGDMVSATLTAIMVGSCLGFLPYNTNPAKIFMGDTGALFLGYVMSLLSIQGLFKFHTAMSFLIPLSIFGLPLCDTTFAFFRRILHGKSPFSPDRGHIHHKLIDMGFKHKQSVHILYAICGILGISAVMFFKEKYVDAGLVIAIGFAIFMIIYIMLKNPSARIASGLDFVDNKDPNRTETAPTQSEDNNKSDSKT